MLRPRGSAALSPGTTLVEDEEVQVHPDENLKTGEFVALDFLVLLRLTVST